MSEEVCEDGLEQELTVFDELRALEQQAENLRLAYLRRQGWDFTCDYPDSRWRWSKAVEGRVLALNELDAMKFEERRVG